MSLFKFLLGKGISFKWTWRWGNAKKNKDKDLRFNAAVRASEGKADKANLRKR